MFFKRYVFYFFYFLTMVVLGLGIFFANYNVIFISILTILLFYSVEFLEKIGKFMIPFVLKFLLFLFIFGAEILGEIFDFYGYIDIWDSLLHYMAGFLSACFGFSMIRSFRKLYDNFKSLPVVCLVIVVCFSMTLGVIWEFFEFNMDKYFDFDMQKDTVVDRINSVSLNDDEGSKVVKVDGILFTEIHTLDGVIRIDDGYLDIGLVDTISDMKINMVGAFTFGVLSAFYVAFPKRFRWLDNFIAKFKEEI